MQEIDLLNTDYKIWLHRLNKLSRLKFKFKKSI